MTDELECERCGFEYSLRDGYDPTPNCDSCAHERVEELEAEVRRLREENALLRGGRTWMLRGMHWISGGER